MFAATGQTLQWRAAHEGTFGFVGGPEVFFEIWRAEKNQRTDPAW